MYALCTIETKRIASTIGTFNKAKMKMLKDCKRWALAQRKLAGAQVELMAVKEGFASKRFRKYCKAKLGMFKTFIKRVQAPVPVTKRPMHAVYLQFHWHDWYNRCNWYDWCNWLTGATG